MTFSSIPSFVSSFCGNSVSFSLSSSFLRCSPLVCRSAPVSILPIRPFLRTPTACQETDERFTLRQKPEELRELCVLVGVDITTRSNTNRLFSLHDSLEELGQLAETAGMTVVDTITQSLSAPHSGTYIGTGKVQEVHQAMKALDCCTCIFDVELSPAQQRTLEVQFGGEKEGIKVLDRTALILDIFAQHAATKEGQLQVELALYQYRLPRLTRMWTHLERQSGMGGVGLRGPGETQLEVDRRLINVKISKLKRDLELVRAHRHRQRAARRRKVGLPVVALIGYTNAGKSTLLNALTGANALTANALFATLDPTTRKATLDGLKWSPEILLTDTVGFVQNLPTQLVAAFRGTLEEVVDADLLLHVVDASADEMLLKWQMMAVEQLLDEIGAGGKPVVVVLNKTDKLSSEETAKVIEQVVERTEVECVPASAKTRVGLDDVGVVVDEALRAILVKVEVIVPYDRGDLISAIYSQGSVVGEDYVAEGTKIVAKVPGELRNRLVPFFIDDDAEAVEERQARVEWADLAKGRHECRGVKGGVGAINEG